MTVGGDTGETSYCIIGGRCVVPALAAIDVYVDVSIYSGTLDVAIADISIRGCWRDGPVKKLAFVYFIYFIVTS